MPAERPTFSVVLLCWNHAPYLEQCVRSLAEQTDPDFEIVFLDNQSTDGSFELARELFAKYGLTPTLLQNERPQGISHNLNRLLAASTGELVCTFSTDDWLDKTYVETMVTLGAEDTESGWFSCSGWLFFDEEGKSVPVDETQFVTDRPVADVIVDWKNPHFFIGCGYRRSALDAVGGWDEGQLIEDRDLFLRLSLRFKHHRTTRRLVHYRRSSMTASANAAFMIKGWELFFSKHAALFGRRLTARRAEVYRSYAALLTDQGRLSDAVAAIVKALTLRPFVALNWRTLAYLGRRLFFRR